MPHSKPSTESAFAPDPVPVRWLHLDQRQARMVVALANEQGFALWPQPVALLVPGLLVADVDLAALEAMRPGFVESLRFPDRLPA